MSIDERIEKAESIASEIKKLSIEPNAKVWSKNDMVRVYIDGGRRCNTSYGYVIIGIDGIADASNARGCIKAKVQDICK